MFPSPQKVMRFDMLFLHSEALFAISGNKFHGRNFSVYFNEGFSSSFLG